ncbi:MAG: hypothetical protein RIQ76_710, partial [Pseudomonadota bacterium]
PYPPGNEMDVVTRLLAEGMSKRLGVPVQVINKPGGGGVVGFAEMTRAKPDGYTIGTWTPGPGISQIVAGNTPYKMSDYQSVGGMFGIYFSEKAPTSFDEIMKSNKEQFNQFFHHMLTSGFYFGPSAFEAGFVSIAHTDEDIHQTIEAAKEVFQVLK